MTGEIPIARCRPIAATATIYDAPTSLATATRHSLAIVGRAAMIDRRSRSIATAIARPSATRDRRSGDDPLFDANSNTDGPPRRYERRRTDDRPVLRPASDSRDDYSQATAEETDWLSSLPSLTDELKQMALKAWRKTRQPERRRELTRRLSSGSVPDLIRKTLQEWLDGPPATAGDVDGERGTLERAIARCPRRRRRPTGPRPSTTWKHSSGAFRTTSRSMCCGTGGPTCWTRIPTPIRAPPTVPASTTASCGNSRNRASRFAAWTPPRESGCLVRRHGKPHRFGWPVCPTLRGWPSRRGAERGACRSGSSGFRNWKRGKGRRQEKGRFSRSFPGSN